MNQLPKVFVLGAGGHAKVCIEILLECGFDVVACIDFGASKDNCLQIPILKKKDGDGMDIMISKGIRHAFVAIGENRLRKIISNEVISKGLDLISAISPKASVSSFCKIGRGSVVMPGAVINASAVISDYCIINTNASVDHDCCIGEATHVGPNSAIAGFVTIGQEVFIGVGASIIPEVNIGDFTTIGAGSVVVRSIPDRCTAFGVPAKIKP